MKTLKELVEHLPPDLEPEVKDFIEFLLSKKGRSKSREPTFEWAGCLKELKNKYTSVELQHEISGWREKI